MRCVEKCLLVAGLLVTTATGLGKRQGGSMGQLDMASESSPTHGVSANSPKLRW